MELEIKGLTKNYGDFNAVDHVNFTFGRGVYGLLGVNGAGKSTWMRMLCTLLTPTEGSITYNGEDIFQMGGEYRKILGYLPQEFGYYPDFTVKDYLLYIASIKGLSAPSAKKRVAEILPKVGLAKVANRKMKKLSGGMKRRAGIAQAILNDPKILILDEPTAGLDPNERIRFRNLLSELATDRLVLLSTHIVSDVEYIANEIMLMKDGQILHAGTVGEIIDKMPTKVWEVHTTQSEVNQYLKNYKVSNLKSMGNIVELRILSDQHLENAVKQCSATLEDVFLYYFGETGGENDGTF